MSYSNGLLSDQSYQTANKYVQRGLPGVGFKLTVTGDYDMQNKKLTNVKSGTDSNDAVNKSQLDATTNLLHGSRAGDVVNDKAVIYSNTGAVHANSLYIEDPPDQGNSNEVRIMTEHQSYPNIHLNIPDLHNFDGHGGRPKSELMVTSVEQTVTGKKVFENIEVHDPTSNNQAANKNYADTKLSLTGGTMTGDLILPHHNYPIPGNTNKVINYESQREIFLSRQESFPMQADINMNNNFIQNIATPTLSHQATNKGYCDYNFLNRQKGGRIMGSLSMNQNDLFEIPAPKYESSAANKNYVDNQMGTKADLSKTTTETFQGRLQVPDFNSGGHNGSDIVNLRYIDGIFLNKKTGGTLNNPITFLSSLPSNQRQIHNIGSPQFISSAANKQYVDGEIGKIAPVDTTPFVKLDGSRTMTGNLDMGGKKIIGVGNPTASFHSTDAVNFHSMVNTLAGFRHGLNISFVHLDGSEAMTGVLNMNNQKISNLKIPEFNTDAANKQYIDEALLKSHLVSSHIENAFKYLSDQDESSSERNIIVHGIQDFNGSPHKNKKAYDIDLIYTSGTHNYDSKIGINLYPLPVGKFTIIMEYYFPEDINISLLAEASTAIINKQTITNFTSYKKQLVQINQQTKDTPDYLFFTIRGSGTTATNPEGYLIFYGVKEWVDTVPSEIYDHALETGMFEYDNGNMKMYNDIDMNNHNIINSNQTTSLTDFMNYFTLFKNFMKNKTYIDTFSNFYDLKEPSTFILDGPAISGIQPNMSINSSGSSHITVSGFDPIKGLQFNSSTKIIINLGFSVNQNTPYTIMVSLTLKSILKVYFVEPINEQTIYYPAYILTPLKNTIGIQKSHILKETVIYPSVFNNKQIMIWINFNPSTNQYKLIIGNGNFVKIISSPTSNFSTNKIRIDANYNIINKICYKNQHFASAETFTKMMFEERKNGSYF